MLYCSGRPIVDTRILRDRDVASVRIGGRRRRRCREWHSRDAGDGEGAQPAGGRRQIAEALSEIERRRVGGERVGADRDAPVPPHSMSRLAVIANSCSRSLISSILNAVSKFWNPLAVGPPAVSVASRSSDRDAELSVMRLENSPAISSSRAAGSSPVLNDETVGSDNSSATHGSSTFKVAGKETVAYDRARRRCPTAQKSSSAPVIRRAPQASHL